MTTYDYNVTTDIPGGQITSDGATGLITKILANIFSAHFLDITQSKDNFIHLTFTNDLSPPDKTQLDAFVNQAGDFFDVLVNNVVIPFFLPVTIQSDGQIHITVILQCKKGDGTVRLGFNYPVTIKTGSILALNARIGNLDPLTGQFSFIIGPDHHRGTTTCIIYVDSLPSRRLAVEFT